MGQGARRRSAIAAAFVLVLLGPGCGGGGSTSPSPGGVTVRQGVGGFAFSPAAFSIGRGGTVTVQNIGSAQHTFTIENQGIDVVNDAGKSQQVTVDLAPGTYQFVCRFHASLGMRGVVTVTG